MEDLEWAEAFLAETLDKATSMLAFRSGWLRLSKDEKQALVQIVDSLSQNVGDKLRDHMRDLELTLEQRERLVTVLAPLNCIGGIPKKGTHEPKPRNPYRYWRRRKVRECEASEPTRTCSIDSSRIRPVNNGKIDYDNLEKSIYSVLLKKPHLTAIEIRAELNCVCSVHSLNNVLGTMVYMGSLYRRRESGSTGYEYRIASSVGKG